MIFLLLLFLFARPLLLLGDGGTCRHFLTGIYIIDHASIPTTTYSSAIEPNSAWVTHELLCDLLFGIPFPAFGLNWVVLSSAIAIALSLTWAYQMSRSRGNGILGAFIAMLLALEACTVHWSARPHVLTYLAFIACYYESFIADRSLKGRVIALSTILFLWGNLHGSFPLGLLMIFFRAGSDFLEEKVLKNESSTLWKLKESLILIPCAVIAACLNIRGAGFVHYVLNYLSSSKIQAHSDEWRSIDFSFAAPVWSFLALCCIMVLSWIYSKSKPKLGECAYMLFLFCCSLYAMRLIPYFVLAALPAMACQLGEIRNRSEFSTLPVMGKLISSDQNASKGEDSLKKHRWILIGATLAVCLAYLLIPSFKIKDFDAERMPVKAVDYLTQHNIKGLGFVKDNWGAYLYWRTKEGIFLDDKTDFYSQNLLDDYSSIFMTNPGWEKALDKYNFRYVLIPRGLPLEFMLAKDNKWTKSYEDNTAILFLKNEPALTAPGSTVGSPASKTSGEQPALKGPGSAGGSPAPKTSSEQPALKGPGSAGGSPAPKTSSEQPALKGPVSAGGSPASKKSGEGDYAKPH